MELKFSFGASNPLPLSSEGAGSALGQGSSMLELHVSLLPDGSTLRCEGRSGDGVVYASAEKALPHEVAPSSAGSLDGTASPGTADPQGGQEPAALAATLRSVLARGGAELPEPLLGTVSAVVLSLGGRELEALDALGLSTSPGAAQLATVDEALQARTGISAGTPIRA